MCRPNTNVIFLLPHWVDLTDGDTCINDRPPRKELSCPDTASTSNSTLAGSRHSRTDSPLLLLPACSSITITGSYNNVHDSYEILPAVLGGGHFGTVREGYHRLSSKVCAIKSISKNGKQNLLAIQREIDLLQSVNHPSIIELLNVCEDEDYVHIITEKYNGGELFDKIVKQGSLPEHEAARIIQSLLSAIEYLHANDIVHRDIKPENLLFEVKEKSGAAIRLIDFGLSRRHNSKIDPPMSNPIGSAYYMSPEVLSRCYDRSSDLWSIGIITYILLCGFPPFNGHSEAEIFESIQREQLEFPEDAWKGISDNGTDFIKCLLQREKESRPSAGLAMTHPWFLCQKI